MEQRYCLRLTVGERFECLYPPPRAFRAIHSTKNSHDRPPPSITVKANNQWATQITLSISMNISAAIVDPLLRRAFGRRVRPPGPHVLLGTSACSRLGSGTRHRRRWWSQSPGLRAPLSRRDSAISGRTVIHKADEVSVLHWICLRPLLAIM